MKTYEYTVKARNLVPSPRTIVTVKWHRKGLTTTERLGRFSKMVVEEGLVSDFPVRSEVDGQKTCVNPCIVAKTFRAAAILSSMSKVPLSPGDGLSLVSQAMAMEVKARLIALHADMDEFATGWRLANPPKPQPQPKAPQWSKAQIEAAQEKLPF
jgi:hypothetical protein